MTSFGLQFFALADFVEAAVHSDHSADARRFIDEVERISAPDPVPWVVTMLCYGKALIATNEEAEQYFLKGLGPAAKNWPFLRGRLLLREALSAHFSQGAEDRRV